MAKWGIPRLNMLTVFGAIAVAVMMFSYWHEPLSKWFVLLFAGATQP